MLIEVVDTEATRAKLKCDAEQGITPEVLAEIFEAGRSREPACSH